MAQQTDTAVPQDNSVQYNWVDITGEFKQACCELKLGELVHDDLFGLYDAMSAIEMMDPKMDVGMLSSGCRRRSLSLEEAINCGEICVDHMSLAELVGVLDASAVYLAAWLDGHSLLQTVCTCLYLQAPPLLLTAGSPLLRTICTGHVHLVNTINQLAAQQGASLLKEEDFQSLSVQDNTEVSARRAGAMLREAENQLSCQLRHSSARRVATAPPSCHPSPANSDQSTELLEALLCRIKFFRHLLHTLVTVAAVGGPSVRARDSSHPHHQPHQQLAAVLDSLKQLEEEALPALQLAAATCQLSAYYQQLCDAADGGHLNIMGFDPLLNQRQLPPAFPRYPRLRRPETVYGELAHTSRQLIAAKSVLQCDELHQLLTYLERFSASSPGVLLRLAVYTMCAPLHQLDTGGPHQLHHHQLQQQQLVLPRFRGGGGGGTAPARLVADAVAGDKAADSATAPATAAVLPSSGVQCLVRAVRRFTAPPAFTAGALSILSQQDHEALDHLFWWCRVVFHSVLTVYGHNRARQRQKLKAVSLSLANLCEEATRLDAQLHAHCQQLEPARRHQGCLSGWLHYHQLRCMIDYQLAGFELQLYSEHEFHYIYWYLAECLCRCMTSVLGLAEAYLLEAATAAAGGAASGDHQNTGRAAKLARMARNATRKIKPRHSAEIARTQAMQYLCSALHKVCVGLERQRRIRRPVAGFDDECVRYQHRLAPFAGVTAPRLPTYSQYCRLAGLRDPASGDPAIGDPDSPLTAYSSSCLLFQQARAVLETLPSGDVEISALIRVAKTNFVVAKILYDNRRCHVRPQFDFTVHRHIAVLRIQ